MERSRGMGEERKEGEWKGVEGEGGGRMEGRVEGSRRRGRRESGKE